MNIRTHYEHGIALLYALLLTSVVLASLLVLFNINLRQLVTVATYRDGLTSYAASRAGLECARFWETFYKDYGTPLSSKSGSTIRCNAQNISLTAVSNGVRFTLAGIGGGTQAPCAVVTVTNVGSSDRVDSRGYNSGDSACNSTNPRRAVRIKQTSIAH